MSRFAETVVPLVPRYPSEPLCTNVLDVLHAASQPLTILRAGLELSEVSEQSPDDLRKLLRRSSKEVERLCVLFDYLQKFMEVESSQSEPKIEDLPLLVKHAMEGVEILFASAGVEFTYNNREESPPHVLVDSFRVAQALSGIFLAVLGHATHGDEVIVVLRGPGACIEVVAELAQVGVVGRSANTRLSMALAAANLRHQGVQMTWKDNPFSVQITLPVADRPISA